MASPLSKSPRRPVSPRLIPLYKFTILSPVVYAPENVHYTPAEDSAFGFCEFLKGKFESHFGMRCSLPTKPGTAYIGNFDEFEELFLVDAEYIVVIVTEDSVKALKKFYPRLLVFVTVRPEWVNRFIFVFVGDVALSPSIDLTVFFHQPIIFKKSNWEADLDTWKALHRLLKVEWKPHSEKEAGSRGEVISIVQRTVVETEVQEVRTRRRPNSRSSDGASSPGSLSPLPPRRPPPPGASDDSSCDLSPAPLRRLSPEPPALHVVPPVAEEPTVARQPPAMPIGRRGFGRAQQQQPPAVLRDGEGPARPRAIIVRAPDSDKTEPSPGSPSARAQDSGDRVLPAPEVKVEMGRGSPAGGPSATMAREVEGSAGPTGSRVLVARKRGGEGEEQKERQSAGPRSAKSQDRLDEALPSHEVKAEVEEVASASVRPRVMAAKAPGVGQERQIGRSQDRMDEAVPSREVKTEAEDGQSASTRPRTKIVREPNVEQERQKDRQSAGLKSGRAQEKKDEVPKEAVEEYQSASVRPRVKMARDSEEREKQKDQESSRTKSEDNGSRGRMDDVTLSREFTESPSASVGPQSGRSQDQAGAVVPDHDMKAHVAESQPASLRPNVMIERGPEGVKSSSDSGSRIIEASRSKDLAESALVTGPSIDQQAMNTDPAGDSPNGKDPQVFVNLTGKTGVAYKDTMMSASSSNWDSSLTSGYSSLDSSISTKSLSAVQSPPVILEAASPAEEARELLETEEKKETISSSSSMPGLSKPVSPKTASSKGDEAISTASRGAITPEKDRMVDAHQVTPKVASKDAAIRPSSPDQEDGKKRSTMIETLKSISAIVKQLWRSGFENSESSVDLLRRPIPVAIIMATATALSPLYRHISLSLFNAISTFLWPPVVAIDNGPNTAVITALPAAKAAELLPMIAAIKESTIGSSSRPFPMPTSILTIIYPTNYVFWGSSDE